MARAVATTGTFSHRVLFYRTADEYVGRVTSFVRGALIEGQPAFVAVPAAQSGWLRDELGAAQTRVRFEDMTELGRNPARIIPALQEFVDAHPREHVRYVGEPIWGARTAPELREATRHEALINLAFGAASMDVMCPYDRSRLLPAVLADAQRTHPVLVADGATRPSRAYGGPGSIPLSCLLPLTPPTDDALSLTYTTELSAVRALVEKQARAVNLPAAKVMDLVMAVSEVAANTLKHARSAGTLDISHDDREIACTIRDAGVIADPLAGRRHPAPGSTQGHGLWLVHQVCDLVELRSDESGTTIRLHMAIPRKS